MARITASKSDPSTTLPSTALRAGRAGESLAQSLSRVASKRERIIVRRNGKNVAAIVPMEDLAALEEMEDRQDSRDFRAAKRQWQREGKKTVPWDKLKAELGL